MPILRTHWLDSQGETQFSGCQRSHLTSVVSPGSTTLLQPGRPQDVWRVSSVSTASRALAIIAVLRAMSLFEGDEFT